MNPIINNNSKNLQEIVSEFQAQMISRRDKTDTEFFIEYIASEDEKQLIDQDYNTYKALKEDNDDMLNKQEWLDEVYGVENGDAIFDAINSHFNPLKSEVFTSNKNPENKIIQLCLSSSDPIVYLELDTQFESVEWQSISGTDTYNLNLNYLYSVIYNSFYYNLMET